MTVSFQGVNQNACNKNVCVCVCVFWFIQWLTPSLTGVFGVRAYSADSVQNVVKVFVPIQVQFSLCSWHFKEKVINVWVQRKSCLSAFCTYIFCMSIKAHHNWWGKEKGLKKDTYVSKYCNIKLSVYLATFVFQILWKFKLFSLNL